MDAIKLNFINRSNDMNNSRILLFQKNVSTDFDSLSVAWRVIENCGTNCNHPFKFPMAFAVDTRDSNGNFTPDMHAVNGQLFAVKLDKSGNVLDLVGPAPSPNDIQIRNDLRSGSIGANIYKDGRLLATKLCVSPGQKATFQFKPSLWIGVASEVMEGDTISSAILSDINTELDLFGIGSADIVMTGGGCGVGSQPFRFRLENVVQAA